MTTTTTEVPLRMLDFFLGELNGNEFKIIMLFWRWTKGTQSATVNISIDDITALAKVNKSAVARAISSLTDKQLILVTKKGGGTSNSYELNHEASLVWGYNPNAAKINGEWVNEYSRSDGW